MLPTVSKLRDLLLGSRIEGYWIGSGPPQTLFQGGVAL